MNIRRGIIGLLTLVSLTAMPVASVNADTLEEIKVEEETKQDELLALENEINQVLDEINAIHVNLTNLEVEIEETELSIEKNQEDIVLKEEEVEKRNEVMKENLRNLQTSEMNHSMVISILNSESITEMFNRIQVLTTLHSASNESFQNAQNEHNELLALREKNESEKEKLENDKETVKAQETDMSKKVANLNTKLENNKEELAVLSERKQNEESRLFDKAKAVENMQSVQTVEDNKEVVQLVEAKEEKQHNNTALDTVTDVSSTNKTPDQSHNSESKSTEQKVEKASQPKPTSKPTQPKAEPTQPKQEKETAPQNEATGRSLTVVATAYSTNQPSLSTHTATGIDLRSNPNVIAVDPSVIPLHSLVEIPGYGVYLAGDTGGAIKGNRIDIHITDLSTAQGFGYQTMNVKILN